MQKKLPKNPQVGQIVKNVTTICENVRYLDMSQKILDPCRLPRAYLQRMFNLCALFIHGWGQAGDMLRRPRVCRLRTW